MTEKELDKAMGLDDQEKKDEVKRLEIAEERLNPVAGAVGFGKYAIAKWKDLPIDYLEYLVSAECRTSEENKKKARQELGNRNKTDGQLFFA